LRCTAGELLGVYALLRHWCDEHAQQPSLKKQRESFYAAVDVVDIIMKAKCQAASNACNLETARELSKAIGKHFQKHKAAYGEEHMKPKHHWMWDIILQLLRDGFVLDQFVVERNHLSIRAFAQHCKNLSAFEHTVLCGSILGQKRELNELVRHDLVGRRAPFPGHPGVQIASELTIHGMSVAVGDVVVSSGGIPGGVLACVCDGKALQVIVQCMRPVSGLRMWTKADSIELWPAAEIQLAAAWRAESLGRTTIVRRF